MEGSQHSVQSSGAFGACSDHCIVPVPVKCCDQTEFRVNIYSLCGCIFWVACWPLAVHDLKSGAD